MKHRLFHLFVLLTLLGSLGSVGAVRAQEPQPPHRPPEPRPSGPHTNSPWNPEMGPRQISAAGAPATALTTAAVPVGPSGFSFRYLQTFGTSDVAYLADNSHMNYPWGLGTDGTNVWIGELFGHRALKYDGAGNFLQQIGTAGDPDQVNANTTLYTISYIATDASGNVWIADDAASHVAEFDSHFADPVGAAFDGSGNLYVSDGSPWWNWSGNTGNQRIQIFDSAGNYLATIGVTGVTGTDNNHLHGPKHITVYGSQLYVADAANHRVQIFNVATPSAPTYVATLGVSGVSGGDNSHFDTPTGVAVDKDYIYIADTGNQRVQVYDRVTRNYVATIGGTWGTANSQFENPTDVIVDAAHRLYVADFVNLRVQQFTHSGATFTYARTYGVTGVPYLTDALHYNRPSGVAVGGDGSIYITEDFGHRLIKLNASGVPQWTVGAAGVKGDWNDANNMLDNPADVAVDSTNHVYVADRWHGRVQIHNSADGSYISTIGSLGCPGGVHIAPNGYLYIADSCDSTVKIYDTFWNPVATMGVSGVSGSDNAHFSWPNGVAVDGNGTIYVSDNNNHRIQVFNSSRVYVSTMGVTGVCGGDFAHICNPDGLFVDNTNRLYVADSSNNRIQVFDSSGAYLTTISGRWDRGNGGLRAPGGVAVDTAGNVYVADWGNNRIQKFAPGTPGWVQSNINGFGDPAIGGTGEYALSAFNGQLYAGSGNGTNTAQVWRTSDGSTWSQFSPAWSSANVFVDASQVFASKLYVGTANTAGMEVWRTDGSTWSQVVSGGFGDADNSDISSFAVFSGQIYAVTVRNDNVLHIYRSPTGDSGS